MASATDGNWQQYSRWLYVMARGYHINIPSGSLLTAIQNCLLTFWSTTDQTGTRPWLQSDFQRKSANPTVGLSGQKPGDPTVEPVYVVVQMLELLARDINKIPMTEAEKGFIDTLLVAGNGAQYGKTSDNEYGTTI